MPPSTSGHPLSHPPIPRQVWVLFALALLLRLLFVLYHAGTGYQLRNDPSMYLILAENLRHGAYSMFHPQDIPDTLKMPGYPVLLYLLGGNVTAMLLLQVVISSLKVPLTYLLAKSAVRRMRTMAAILAAGLMAVEPVDIILAGSVLTECVFGTLVLGGLLLLVRGRGMHEALAAALLFAAAAWVRPNGVLLIGLAALLLAVLDRRAGRPLAFLATALVLVAPWAMRNQRVSGRFHLGDNGPVTAAYFHVPGVLAAAGDPRAATWRADLERRAASTHWEDRASFTAYFDGLRADVRAILAEHPFAWARTHALKSAGILVAPGRGHIRQYFGTQPLLEWPLLSLSAMFSLILLLALAWWSWHARRSPRGLRVLLTIAAFLIVTGGIATVDARYKNPAMPMLLVMVAWAAQGMAGTRSVRRILSRTAPRGA